MLEESHIAKVLGGQRLIGKVDSALDLSDHIQRGFPSQAAFYLQSLIGLGDKEYSLTIGISPKTLGRYRSKPILHLKPNVSDNLYRVARIFALAEDVLEDQDAAQRWLHRPQTGLGERAPLDLMRDDAGSREVEELLYRIEYGIYS